MSTVLVLGATSDIAMATADLLAKKGHHLQLSARNQAQLAKHVDTLSVKYPLIRIESFNLDIEDLESHDDFYQELNPKPDIVITAIGYLGNETLARDNEEELLKIFSINCTSIIHLLNIIAFDFEDRKTGTIVGIGSVAGDRGRKQNGHYGAAKAGFHTYLSALRNRLHDVGVSVITIKPGFIKTKMTQDLKMPTLLMGTPSQVAKDILSAISNKKTVIYTPKRWGLIMRVIKMIPEYIFKKLSL